MVLECSGRDKDFEKLCPCLQLHVVAQKFASGGVCHLLPLRTFGEVFADAFQPIHQMTCHKHITNILDKLIHHINNNSRPSAG